MDLKLLTEINLQKQLLLKEQKIVDGDKSTEVKADGITIKMETTKLLKLKNKYGKEKLILEKTKGANQMEKFLA